jgi:hypothetical protein
VQTPGIEPTEEDVEAANLVLSLLTSTPSTAKTSATISGSGDGSAISTRSRTAPLSAIPSNVAAEMPIKRESSQPADGSSAGSPNSTGNGGASPGRIGFNGPTRITLKVSRQPLL